MLDVITLRVVFTIVAWTMLSHFYWRTYRVTRRAYSGWWCAALGFFMVGASAFLLDGSSQQWWANPLGNVGLVLGAGAVWAGARSLRVPSRVPRRYLFTCAAVVAAVSLGDHPATNRWSGAYLFLAVMAAILHARRCGAFDVVAGR